MDRQARIYKAIPKYFKPGNNRTITAFLNALAAENTTIDTALSNAKDQLFVSRASGQYLDLLGSNVGVARPTVIAFSDDLYRQFIPLASFAPKQVKQSIYRMLALFWPNSYMHSTTTSVNASTYNLVGGESLTIVADKTHTITVTFAAADFATPGAATAQEVVDKINAYAPTYITAAVNQDNIGSYEYVDISTNTYGLAGSIQVSSGTANSVLGFSTTRVQSTRVSLHEINPNELVVRIPENITITNDTLLWSHHFHEDSTIVDGDPPSSSDPYWPGSFLYDRPSGSSITLYSTVAILSTNIVAGSTHALLDFDDVSDFASTGGYLVLDFGNGSQEDSLAYYDRVTNTQLRVNPAHVFEFNHAPGTVVNLMGITPAIPDTDGSDYGIYFVDTDIGQDIAQVGMLLLKAAGIIVRFVFSE